MTEISVCHVKNHVSGATMVGDLARKQSTQDGISRVCMLAWFDIESRDHSDSVKLESLNIQNTYRINKKQYKKAKSVLSDYDIIHTHRPHSGFYAKLIGRRLGKPIIQTEHNNHVGYTRKGQIANGLTNTLADSIVCVSESVYESFSWWEKAILNGKKVSVIHNGIDFERVATAKELEWSIYNIADIDPEAVIIGSAGMLTEQKAHDVLIEAVDRANAESDQPIELVISGDGDLRGQLEAQIEDAEYSNRLHLLGFLEDREQVYKMMHDIDIYAMPSRWEGFCVAALEAMALGNACIFSDIPEFRRPFEDIAYFHEVDSTSNLSRQIRTLTDNLEEKQQLGKKASECVREKYTMEITAEKYLQIYEDVL